MALYYDDQTAKLIREQYDRYSVRTWPFFVKHKTVNTWDVWDVLDLHLVSHKSFDNIDDAIDCALTMTKKFMEE